MPLQESGAAVSRNHPEPNWTAVRLALWERSRGRCEGCGRHLGEYGEVHHRKLRSRGGGHELTNLLLLHPACHRYAHKHPAHSTELGWMVPSEHDPAACPVVRFVP